MNELEALVALTSIPHLGPVKIKLLLKTFGSSINALNADIKTIEEMKGFGNKIAVGFKSWQDDCRWKDNLDLCKRYGVQIIPFTSTDYPQDLLKIDDYPLMLYVLGDLKTKAVNLAVVGTRQASIYGLEAAAKISGDLAAQGFTIVSGLARGIDTAAHLAALKKGRTVAVIGSGLSDIYPKENLILAEEIAKNGGAVISEFPMMTPPERQNFPRRNRIVSGLSQGTLLIEAPIKSGAMITMEMALSQRRKLFAIPGRIDNENFSGNHLLIKNGHAKLIENAADISKTFESFEFLSTIQPQSLETGPLLTKDEQELFYRLPNEEFSIEELVELTKWPIAKLNVLLMCLMLKRAIKEYPGKIYKKLNRG